MIVRFLLLSILLTTGISAYAADRFLLKFELTHGDKKVDWGKAYVSQKAHTWSKGLKRSYLKLRCHQRESGKTEKMLSTVDYFSGLRVTHQLVDKNIRLTVVRNVVRSRLPEIRALPKKECRDLSPIVTTVTETYTFPAKAGIDESHPFGEKMTFRVTLQLVGESW